VDSGNNDSWIGTATFRSIIVVVLIGVIVPFWIYLVFFTNLPMILLALIALVMLLLLSTATAWSAIAIPKRGSDNDANDRPGGPD
jgi:prepilin signal peptidase PulO-like enzyme (type II secretory pathway)